MTPSRGTARAFALLGAAAGVALAFRVAAATLPGRIDVAVSAGVVVLALAALAACRAAALPPRVWQLAVPAALAVAAMLWRDSPVLFLLDLAVFGSTLLLLVPHARAPRAARAGVTDYARAGLAWAGASVAGPLPLLLREVRWGELPALRAAAPVRRVAVGLAAAVPCLVVFGALFRSADPAYDRALRSVVRLDALPVADDVVIVAAWTWAVAGYLWLASRGVVARSRIAPHGRAGSVEVVTALAAVLVLFASFLTFQASYLFGGEPVVRAMGLTYSEYARRGFFELVAVALLALPLLLLSDWAVQPDDPHVRRVRWLEGALAAAVFVLLASALDRMRLYTAMYGLTELRLYATAFMGWLTVVLGWLLATVLRGRRSRFAWGAVTSGWLVIGALHLLNPDALIVQANAGRTSGFDTAYAAGLSADAVPALLDAIQAAPPNERCRLAAEALAPLASAAQRTDRWTLGRLQARRLLAHRPVDACR